MFPKRLSLTFLKSSISRVLLTIVVAWIMLLIYTYSYIGPILQHQPGMLLLFPLENALWFTPGGAQILFLILIASYTFSSFFIWVVIQKKTLPKGIYILMAMMLIAVIMAYGSYFAGQAEQNRIKTARDELVYAQYFDPDIGRIVKGNSYSDEQLGISKMIYENEAAFGDVNGDGIREVVMRISTTSHKVENGDHDNLVVLTKKNGVFSYLAQKNVDIYDVKSITIKSGIIIVNMYNSHNPKTIFKYKLSGDQLVEVQ